MKDLRELVAKLKALAWDDSGLCVDPDLDEIADELAAPPAEPPASEYFVSQIGHGVAGPLITEPPAAPRVTNGHVLKDCDCNKHSCPICTWGAGVCANCGAAEVELEQPCKKPVAPAVTDLLKRLLEWDHFDTAGDGAYWRKEINALLTAQPPAAPTVPPAVLDSTAWSEDFRAGYAKAASDFYHRGFSEGAKYEQARLRAAPPADTWKQKAREWLEHEQKRMPGGPCSYFGVETVIDMLARFAAAPGEKGSKS